MGYYPTAKAGEFTVYETESDLRDSEQIPLDESIISYFEREVLPHVEEAWFNLDSVKIGYEISFNKYFYKHTPLRSIEEVKADLLALEEQVPQSNLLIYQSEDGVTRIENKIRGLNGMVDIGTDERAVPKI